MKRASHDAGATALQVIEKLCAAGHVALLAGGCVRDKLLSRDPKDFDVATDAIPDQVRRLFPHTREVGAKFGVVLVRWHGHDTEVATFRADGGYSDGRHPDAVRFGDQVEDAKRRDFTINGLFFDPVENRVIDHVEGRADLRARIVRTIGDPERRFEEDHLRMLRAVRFAARLNFRIESNTMTAIRRLGEHLRAISAERVWQELEAILTAPTRAIGWDLLLATGLRSHLQEHWTPDPDDDEIVRRRLHALPAEPIPSMLALAAVLASYGASQRNAIATGLRLANRLIKTVDWLVGSLVKLRDTRTMELADLKLLMANDYWSELVELLRVDLAATGSNRQRYDDVLDWAATVPQRAVAPPPLLDGNDLQEMGLSAGPRIGQVLHELYRAQLNELVVSPNQARALARRLLDSH